MEVWRGGGEGWRSGRSGDCEGEYSLAVALSVVTGRAREDEAASLSCEPRLVGEAVGDVDGEFDTEEVTSCFALIRSGDEGSMAGFLIFSFDGDVHTTVSWGVWGREGQEGSKRSGQEFQPP